MIRCASGSIQVVTKVARLCCGSPSRASSSPIRRIASTRGMPRAGKLVLGHLLGEEAVAVTAGQVVCARGFVGHAAIKSRHAGWRITRTG